MYEPNPGFDPSRQNSAQKKLKSGFWVALDHTENWISQTLARSPKGNPHDRKEVSYDCELNQHALGVIAGIFRRYKEARQLAQKYEYYEKRALAEDPNHVSDTLKRTQVMILPFCEYFDKFEAFEGVIEAINRARTNALNLVTDIAVEKAEKKGAGLLDQEWSAAINGAFLHPEYQTPQSILDELEKQGAMNAEKQNQMDRKNRARQSPYPTLIIEVKSEPQAKDSIDDDQTVDKVEIVGASSDAVKQLESIYAKSAVLHKRTDQGEEDIFYNSIGYVAGIEEVVPENAMESTKEWVVENDPRYSKNFSTFISSDLKHADSAFEFVFLNLSLHNFLPNNDDLETTKQTKYKPGARSYLVLPKFASSSATSFEKFTSDVRNIIKKIDGLDDRVSVTAMHPEDVEADRRSPSPVIILQWFNEVTQ